MSSFHYHLCQHSLAYWINGNKVVHEGLSVKDAEILSPTFYLFAISMDVANTWEADTPVKFQQFWF